MSVYKPLRIIKGVYTTFPYPLQHQNILFKSVINVYKSLRIIKRVNTLIYML